MPSKETKQDVIEFKPLNQIVFERLHLKILGNRLKPGDPLRQEEITERLGVSRTPVREAIQRLQAEGLVTFVPRKGEPRISLHYLLGGRKRDAGGNDRAALEAHSTSPLVLPLVTERIPGFDGRAPHDSQCNCRQGQDQVEELVRMHCEHSKQALIRNTSDLDSPSD
jgi:DNA-binding transcriptional MocR family regulator